VTLSADDVRAASLRLAGHAHRTPVLTSRTLDERVGAQVHLKAESFQRVGAFKFRGAFNAVSMLSAAQRRAGVCAASSGNHAQALALSAAMLGASATILMPRDSPAAKLAATRGYGAQIELFDRYSTDRDELTQRVATERGMTIVHPFDDPAVMAGAGTVALELLRDVEDLDVLVVCTSGGGLLSGCATIAKALRPQIRVIGVEPRASAAMSRSLAAGRRTTIDVQPTIADGQQLAAPGHQTFAVIQRLVDEVVTVTDDEIRTAMLLLFERLKVVVEPSGASALAAILAGHIDVKGAKVGVTISGGNVDALAFGEHLALAQAAGA